MPVSIRCGGTLGVWEILRIARAAEFFVLVESGEKSMAHTPSIPSRAKARGL
jgi:hypothetical protein